MTNVENIIIAVALFFMISFAVLISFSWHRSDFTTVNTQGIIIDCDLTNTSEPCTATPIALKDTLLQANDPLSQSILSFMIYCLSGIMILVALLLLIKYFTS